MLISHASRVMLKVFQANPQLYVNQELPAVQTEFRKSRGTKYQIDHILWIIVKVRELQKNISSYFINYAKTFDCVDHKKLWKIVKEMGIADHFAYLFRNLYTGQEATIRTRHGTTNWFQIRKGVHQDCILSPCLFNLYTEFGAVQFSCSVMSDSL